MASAIDSRVDFVLSKAPTEGASAISVGPDYFAFFGGFERSSMIALVERSTLRLRLIQLLGPTGSTLSPTHISTRGRKVVAVAEDKLYRLDQEILLGALGAWTESNTSTLSSAVQYLNEEAAYSSYYVIYPNGPKKFPERLDRTQTHHDMTKTRTNK